MIQDLCSMKNRMICPNYIPEFCTNCGHAGLHKKTGGCIGCSCRTSDILDCVIDIKHLRKKKLKKIENRGKNNIL